NPQRSTGYLIVARWSTVAHSQAHTSCIMSKTGPQRVTCSLPARSKHYLQSVSHGACISQPSTHCSAMASFLLPGQAFRMFTPYLLAPFYAGSGEKPL